ncbi:Ulp1 protease family [Theobroma cacao]|nr:Ulp1 protease family [Theobroma cacao]
MALVLIVNNILFGQDYRRRVTPWLLSLVEDIDAWNVFPWGHYVWKLTLDYLLKGFKVPDSSVTKGTRLCYNIYGFAWFLAMKAISTFRKIVAPSGLKDNVYPRMCRWDYNQKPKDFYKAIQKLESSDHLWAQETLEPTANEALREYFMDLDVPLSEGHEYMPIEHMEDRSDWGLGAKQKRRNLKEKRASGGTKRLHTTTVLVDELSGPKLMDEGDDHGQGSEQLLDHAPTAPEPPTSPPQTQNGNDPLLTQSRTVNDGAVTTPQLRWIMRKHEKEMLELKASIQSLSVAMHMLEDRIIGRILDDLKSQGGPFDGASLEHDDADDGQHHEPSVDIDDDVLGADGKHVTHVDDVVDEVVAVDVTLQSDDAEGEDVPLPESIFDASARGDGEHDSVVAIEREHLPPADAFIVAAIGDIVLYRGSTPNAIEIRSSSPESPAVHHGAAEISNPTERARLKMASKYMTSPFVDLLVTHQNVRDKIVEDYEAFKKDEHNVGIVGDQRAEFFITLKDPNEEMTSEHIDTCISLLYKQMTGSKSKLYTTCAYVVNTIFLLHTKFPTEDARATMQILDELQGYVKGERSTYGKKWEDVDFILAPCNVGGHWVVAKIDLVRWTIKVVDSVRTSDAKDNGVRAGQMTPLTTMMPSICHQAGYFNNIHRKRQDLRPMPLDIHLPKAKVHQ